MSANIHILKLDIEMIYMCIYIYVLTVVSLSVTLISNSVRGLSSPSSTTILPNDTTGRESSTGIILTRNDCVSYRTKKQQIKQRSRLTSINASGCRYQWHQGFGYKNSCGKRDPFETRLETELLPSRLFRFVIPIEPIKCHKLMSLT